MPKMFSFRYISLVWTIFWDSNLLFIYIYIMSCYIILGFFFSRFMNLSDKISKTACDSSCIFFPWKPKLVSRKKYLNRKNICFYICIYICINWAHRYREHIGSCHRRGVEGGRNGWTALLLLLLNWIFKKWNDLGAH